MNENNAISLVKVLAGLFAFYYKCTFGHWTYKYSCHSKWKIIKKNKTFGTWILYVQFVIGELPKQVIIQRDTEFPLGGIKKWPYLDNKCFHV